MVQSSFLLEAKARGFIHQCTDLEGLNLLLSEGPVSAYTGFDCTADSLHVGSLMQIMLLRLLARHNHKPVVLLGGGTTMIGDPSFRTEARQMLSDEQIDFNMKGIFDVLKQFLDVEDETVRRKVFDNGEWLSELNYIDMLRDVGPHFSLNRMLSFDSVKSRREREQGMSFLEFNYAILQSYDFRELYRRVGVRLQMGGSDQWANIISGVDLVRRTDTATVFGLTTPLIQTSSGEKMGKTGTGTIWLDPIKLAPFDYWQFWRNTEDGDVYRFLRLFTDLPVNEINAMEFRSAFDINDAKVILATDATRIAHGSMEAIQARLTASSSMDGAASVAGLPVRAFPAETLGDGMTLFRVLVEAGLASSNGDARKLVRGGGVAVAGATATDEGMLLTAGLIGEEGIRLSVGKKRHVRLMLS